MLILSRWAASLRRHLVSSNACTMASFSASALTARRDHNSLPASRGGVFFAGEVAAYSLLLMGLAPTGSSSPRIRKRLTKFSSSRTFPGQEYLMQASRTLGEYAFGERPN